ncbi:MAG: IS21 family transposase [Chloroflexi bacterium]|uniref:IS21 family transposase n=2 Tax=Candidatus Chlorohelix allophototropha TaxID=3003348 RepID=A0A8T7M4E1_9CHLR|nr:IS21 family transposase [Chloroflexota bacterium]WJW65940.1 IS21 family transposase [Chloroflexota bacterium L227-S17]NWJ45711.1 IS21 family transposase [Chloroflexota bacterium]NWJ46067.1 IS21 family transposase [Chloroflexota bacterium]NWJ46571.1 IS21 family transposase [Chloroflexota bacterium]
MLEVMARSAIKYHRKRGDNYNVIAGKVQHDARTVKRVLNEPSDKVQTRPNRESSVAVFKEQIEGWLEQKLQVKRMLELAWEDPKQPYCGRPTAFYDYVRKLKKARENQAHQVQIRFEGLPGEFLQIDWGEIRGVLFSKQDSVPQTFYFFCARLKYSRFMYVSFQKDMAEETLVRCLVEALNRMGGVPWVITTDNMKTVVLRRDEKNQPVWHPVWQKLALEFEFHPEACAPASGNQKGAVENLVKYTKNNFLAGRTFYDAADLVRQLEEWLGVVNYERTCAATGEIPGSLLEIERKHFSPLPASARDYGLFTSLVVNREGVVIFETNKYSVPAELMGQTLTARIHREWLKLWRGTELVAQHPRCYSRNRRLVIPEHYTQAFEIKPRARTMVWRDWLLNLGPQVYQYVAVICRRQRATMSEQIHQLYALAQQVGLEEFQAAVELATEQQLYGAEYLKGLLLKPAGSGSNAATLKPTQPAVERLLSEYEPLVANRFSAIPEENEIERAVG